MLTPSVRVSVSGNACNRSGCGGRPCQVTWPSSKAGGIGVAVSVLVGVVVGVLLGVTVSVGVVVGVLVAVGVLVTVGVGVAVGWVLRMAAPLLARMGMTTV